MLIGTASVAELAERAPVLASFHPEPVVLEHVEVLQVIYEIAAAHRAAALPPALHPTDPPIVTWLFFRCPSSPWGAFSIAQTRIECRSGLRLRGFLISAVVDNVAAAGALRDPWGYATQSGRVTLRRHYDTIDGSVVVHDTAALDVSVVDPGPLAAADLQYVANMNLAHMAVGLRLVQVEPKYEVHRAERGRPRLGVFDGAAWGDPRVRPVHPVSASCTVATVTIPRIRFVCRPDVLAFEGTELVR